MKKSRKKPSRLGRHLEMALMQATKLVCIHRRPLCSGAAWGMTFASRAVILRWSQHKRYCKRRNGRIQCCKKEGHFPARNARFPASPRQIALSLDAAAVEPLVGCLAAPRLVAGNV